MNKPTRHRRTAHTTRRFFCERESRLQSERVKAESKKESALSGVSVAESARSKPREPARAPPNTHGEVLIFLNHFARIESLEFCPRVHPLVTGTLTPFYNLRATTENWHQRTQIDRKVPCPVKHRRSWPPAFHYTRSGAPPLVRHLRSRPCPGQPCPASSTGTCRTRTCRPRRCGSSSWPRRWSSSGYRRRRRTFASSCP